MTPVISATGNPFGASISASEVAADVATQAELDAVANARARVLAQSGVGVSHTGTTSETTLATITVPAGVIGPNGSLEIAALFGRNSGGTGNVTPRVKFGTASPDTYLTATMNTSSLSARGVVVVHNRNAADSQVGGASGAASGAGTTGTAPVTGAKDTASAQDIVITGQCANSGDTITLDAYQVKLSYGA